MIRIRPYRPEDREAVRNICCETGFMGKPLDPLFSDRDLFADFFTSYYTDVEPQNAIVAETDNNKIVGYILCCTCYRIFPLIQAWIVLRRLPLLLWRVISGMYSESDIRFMRWFVLRSFHETPTVPSQSAHFHINIMPDFRSNGVGRKLLDHFNTHLDKQKVERIYGQIQTFPNRRSARVFHRLGFDLFDQRLVTKFRPLGIDDVYVSTYVRGI